MHTDTLRSLLELLLCGELYHEPEPSVSTSFRKALKERAALSEAAFAALDHICKHCLGADYLQKPALQISWRLAEEGRIVVLPPDLRTKPSAQVLSKMFKDAQAAYKVVVKRQITTLKSLAD